MQIDPTNPWWVNYVYYHLMPFVQALSAIVYWQKKSHFHSCVIQAAFKFYFVLPRHHSEVCLQFQAKCVCVKFHSLPLITHHYFHNSCKPFNTQLLLKNGRTALIGTLMLMTIPSAGTCRILDCALVWGVFFYWILLIWR